MIQDPPDENNAPGSPRRFCYGRTRRRTRRPSSPRRRRRRRRRPVQRDDHYIKYVEESVLSLGQLIMILCRHTTQGSSKKTFKVLCQFRVLVDWKKKGGGILNLCFLLCLTKSTRFGYGAGLFLWQNRFKNTTRAFITQERLRSHAKEVRYTRGTRKERKRFLFFTEKGIAECGRAER